VKLPKTIFFAIPQRVWRVKSAFVVRAGNLAKLGIKCWSIQDLESLAISQNIEDAAQQIKKEIKRLPANLEEKSKEL
jgi:hypothetical protein